MASPLLVATQIDQFQPDVHYSEPPLNVNHLQSYYWVGMKGLMVLSQTPELNIQIVTWDNWTHSHEATLAQNLSGGQGPVLCKFPSKSPPVAAKLLRLGLKPDVWKTSKLFPFTTQVW